MLKAITSGFVSSNYKDKPITNEFIPAPFWEISGRTTYKTVDNITFEGDIVGVRIPFMENISNLYVQFGRLKSRSYTNRPKPRYKGKGIRWYSSCDDANVTPSGSGFLGGNHGSYNKDRRNLFPITSNNELIKELPYYNFYELKSVNVYDPDILGFQTITLPHMTGGRIIKTRDLNNALNGSPYYKHRPRNQNMVDITHSVIEWYCRIVRVQNKRLIEVGEVSMPLITSPNPIGYDDFLRKIVPYKFNSIVAKIEY